jgi:hypothetical protein
MRWRTRWLCVLSLVAMTGCPEEFGIDGRVDQAVSKDMKERLMKQCTESDLRKHCGPDKSEEECRKQCG